MLKLFPALLLVLAAWGIGLEKQSRLTLRVKRLLHLADGLMCMEGEIRSSLSPIPSALSEAGKYDPLFETAAQLSFEKDVTTAFLEALQKNPFENAETEILTVFAKGLSATDEKGQLQNLSVCRKRLEALTSAAQKDAARLGRLYSRGGAMLGLLVAILLL